MIKVWFNERGFFIEAPKGHGHYLYDVPDDVLNDASMLYAFRWAVLNHAMEDLQLLCDDPKGQDLMLYSDSRLVEEIQGDITPDNNFARQSLQYFLLYDSSQYGRIDCRKCSSSAINNRLRGDDKPCNATT